MSRNVRLPHDETINQYQRNSIYIKHPIPASILGKFPTIKRTCVLI